MKYKNKIGMMVMAGAVLAITSCSDYSDYNTVPVDSTPTADKTLYENIKSISNLSDFATIIDKVNYGKVLATSQYYTIWAPVNGTYDAKEIMAMDSASIVDRFLKQHMAQFSYQVSGDVDERVISLNDKHHSFTNVKFDEFDMELVNIPSSNGMLHAIKGASAYYNSIYQYVEQVKGLDCIANFIKEYDEKYIDTYRSVKGPMVNGQQTYLDTVWTLTNPVVKTILRANIEDEDSMYVMLLPTDDAWKKAKKSIDPKYKYITGFRYMDITENGTGAASLKSSTALVDKAIAINADLYTDSLPKTFVARNLVYSLSYPQNAPLATGQLIGTAEREDTLYSTTRTKISNVAEVLSHCGEKERMSNGYVRVIDSLCFKPQETYNPVLSYQSPIRTLNMKVGKSYTRNSLLKTPGIEDDPMFSELPDFLKSMIIPRNSKYIRWISTDTENFFGTTSRPELDFDLKGVLSQKYKIYVVFCPLKIKDGIASEEENTKPLYVRFDMASTKADGTPAYERLNVKGADKATADIVVPGNGKFNVVELEYTFPICYYGLEAFPTLFVSHTKMFNNNDNREKFEQELRIAGIYLVPADAEDYVKK